MCPFDALYGNPNTKSSDTKLDTKIRHRLNHTRHSTRRADTNLDTFSFGNIRQMCFDTCKRMPRHSTRRADTKLDTFSFGHTRHMCFGVCKRMRRVCVARPALGSACCNVARNTQRILFYFPGLVIRSVPEIKNFTFLFG